MGKNWCGGWYVAKEEVELKLKFANLKNPLFVSSFHNLNWELRGMPRR